MENIKEKIKVFAELLEKQQIDRLKADGLGCDCNILNARVSIKEGKKYVKVDVGNSGMYMIDAEGEIFGIKAYGVINRLHHFGNLDTTNKFYWGDYRAYLITWE